MQNNANKRIKTQGNPKTNQRSASQILSLNLNLKQLVAILISDSYEKKVER